MKDKKLYWGLRKSFCKSVCPDGCPQLKDDIEGGGGIVVSCDKYHRFIEELEKYE